MKIQGILITLISLMLIQCTNKPSDNRNKKIESTEKKLTETQSESLNSKIDIKENIQEALFRAVKTGNDTLEITNLIKKGADVNFIDKDGNYALLIANDRKNDSIKGLIVNKLIDVGALEINSLVGQYFKYCKNGDIDGIELMLRDGLNINWTDKYYEELEEGGGCGCLCKKTAIFIAAKNQNIKLVEYLVEKGAKVYFDEGYLQPLEPAILSKNWKLAKLLIKNGANKDVSVCLWWGWNGLTSGNTYYHKLKFQDTITLNFLFENQFPYPEADNNWISTPLDYAVMGNDTLILKRLIKINQSNEALSKSLCYSRNINVAKILIKNGAHTNFVYSWAGEGNSGKVISPLYTAIKNENSALVNLYIKNGADVNILYDDYNGETLELPSYYDIGYPLLIAVEKGDISIVNKLLESGAKVNFAIRRNYIGAERKDIHDTEKYAFWQTPLIAAVERNDKDMVELLIENGAELIVEGDTLTNYTYGKKTDEEILDLLNSRLN